MQMLFVTIFYIVAMVLDLVLGIDFSFYNGYFEQSLGYGPIYIIVSLFHWIPTVSAAVRRLHDSDRSGWWFFGPVLVMLSALLIGGLFAGLGISTNSDSMTIIGIGLGIILYLVGIGLCITQFVFMFFDGTKGDNRFGPSNKYDSEGELIN